MSATQPAPALDAAGGASPGSAGAVAPVQAGRAAGGARAVLGLLAIVTCGLLPFLGQDLAIDEEAQVLIADHIRADPLRPYHWVRPLKDFADPRPGDFLLYPHPPLWQGILALVRSAVGEAGTAMRLAVMPLAWAFALAAFDVARRLTVWPMRATLLTLAAPAIWVALVDSLMPDLALLALSTWAIAAQLRAAERRSLGHAALSGALLGAACLVKYLAALLIPVVVAIPCLHGETRSGGRRAIGIASLPAAMAALAIAAFQAYTLAVYGRAHLYAVLADSPDVTAAPSPERALAALVLLAGTGILPPTWGAALAGSAGRGRALAAGVGAAVAACAAFAWAAPLSGYSPVEHAAIAGLALSALGLIGHLATRAARDPSERLLLGWALAWTVPIVLLLPFVAARYLAPAVLPLAIFVVRAASARPEAEGRMRAGLTVALALTFASGLACAVASASLARAHAELARVAAERYRDWPGTVWFSAEWGLRHGLERAGFRYLPMRADAARLLRSGDVVLLSDQAVSRDAAGLGLPLTPIERREASSAFPVRVLHYGARAGFYSNHWGLLPWAFSRAPVDALTAWRVR